MSYRSWRHKCIDAYQEVSNPEEWLECPNCALRPLVWIFDNGRSTACGCGENEYVHFTVRIESILSRYKRTGTCEGYGINELRDAWNTWVETGTMPTMPEGAW